MNCSRQGCEAQAVCVLGITFHDEEGERLSVLLTDLPACQTHVRELKALQVIDFDQLRMLCGMVGRQHGRPVNLLACRITRVEFEDPQFQQMMEYFKR